MKRRKLKGYGRLKGEKSKKKYKVPMSGNIIKCNKNKEEEKVLIRFLAIPGFFLYNYISTLYYRDQKLSKN